MPNKPVFFNILKLKPYVMQILVSLLLITNLTTLGIWYSATQSKTAEIQSVTIDNEILKNDNTTLTEQAKTHVALAEQLQVVIKDERRMLKEMQAAMDSSLLKYTQTLDRINKESSIRRLAKYHKQNKRQYSNSAAKLKYHSKYG